MSNENLVGQIVSVAWLGNTSLALVTAQHGWEVAIVDRWGGRSRCPRDRVWSEAQRLAALRSSYVVGTPGGDAAYALAVRAFHRDNAEEKTAILSKS